MNIIHRLFNLAENLYCGTLNRIENFYWRLYWRVERFFEKQPATYNYQLIVIHPISQKEIMIGGLTAKMPFNPPQIGHTIRFFSISPKIAQELGLINNAFLNFVITDILDGYESDAVNKAINSAEHYNFHPTCSIIYLQLK